LKDRIASNKVLAAGLSNPKCLAAIDLMQKNPKEAKKRFESDVEVTLFIQEFGKMMSEHFNSLAGEKSSSSSGNAASTAPAVAPVQELGPLQAAVIKKNR
jgi:hypothetical protein